MSKGKAAVATFGFVMATAFACTVAAEESPWYMGGNVGQSDYKDVGDEDTTWGLRGGYRFTPYFGAEVGYVDFGELSDNIPDVGSATLSANAIEAVGVGSYPVAERFSVFGKLGLYRGEAKATLDLADVDAFSGSDTNTDLTYGIGVQYDLRPNLGVLGAWQRYANLGDVTDIDVMGVGLQFRF
jgi:OmpA-OmpF porin, OOP family